MWFLWAPLLLLVVAGAALVAGHRVEQVAMRRALRRSDLAVTVTGQGPPADFDG